jgi:hypothetical protein
MTSAIAKELPPYRLDTVNNRHADGERFRVHVLGRFRLLGGDTPITIPPRLRKPQELLQALIAFGGTEVSAGVLIDALWPDSEGDAAYHALESALYRLRQLLGARDAVRMEGGKASLNRDQLWVDMWKFEEELQRPHDPEANRIERIGRLRRLYQGHFLQHEAERPWVLRARQRANTRAVGRMRRTCIDAQHRGWRPANHHVLNLFARRYRNSVGATPAARMPAPPARARNVRRLPCPGISGTPPMNCSVLFFTGLSPHSSTNVDPLQRSHVVFGIRPVVATGNEHPVTRC